MKIVLVTGIAIFPSHAGNRSRMLALARAIRALGHELWVVLLPATPWEPNDVAAHREEFGADRFVELTTESPWQHLARKLRWLPYKLRRKLSRQLGLEAGYYSALDENYQAVWSQELTQLHECHNFDLALVEYVFNSKAFDAFPTSVRRVIDTHDSFADRHKPYIASGILRHYWLSLRPGGENRGFRRADAIIAIQEQEAANFRHQMGQNADNPEVFVVNHFLDLSERPVEDFSPCRALFLASDNSANTLSARTFIERTLPLIVRRLPEFRLVLAGSICRMVDDHPAVEKLGLVDQLKDAFATAPLLVNPMLVGTGINIKLLDALAAGVPTVSTDTGARGLADEYRASVFVVPTDDHQAFADKVVELLEDSERRRSLGRNARDAAVRWNERQAQALRSVLEPGAILIPNTDMRRSAVAVG